MRFGSLVSRTLGFLLLIGCKEKPAPPASKLEEIRFPAVMLFSSSSIRICNDRNELTNLHTNYLKLNEGSPTLIDSEFKIYSLDQFQSVHGGLWLMANPSAMTEVKFELKAQASGQEKARELLVRQLEKQTGRDDLEERRKALASKQTLLEMAAALERN